MWSEPVFVSSLLLLSFVFLKFRNCWELYRIKKVVLGVFLWAVYEQQVTCVATVGYMYRHTLKSHRSAGSLMTSPVCPTWGAIFRL